MDLELGGMATLNPFFPRDAFKLPATILIPNIVFIFRSYFSFFILIFACPDMFLKTHKKKGTQRYIQTQESMERRVKDIDRKGNE